MVDSYTHKWPLPEGIERVIVQSAHAGHPGLENAVDIPAPEGTLVYAFRSGKIVAVKSDSDKWGFDPKFADDANYALMVAEDGTFDQYVHLKKNNVFVKVGQLIKAGEPIGRLGCSGYMTETHLHLNYAKLNGSKVESLLINFES